jgi:predicted transcriptional regulator
MKNSIVVKKRCKKEEILSKILKTLSTGSYNILQISKETGINWETVKNAVQTLEKINLVSKKDNKYFVNKVLDFNENTLLGLPISKEQKNATLGLAKRIIDKWNKKTSKPIKKTFLQKMLIKVIKQANIQNIPYGWYLFGECAVLRLEPDSIAADSKYDKYIKPVIEEYFQIPNTQELLKKHYIEEGNDLYLLRLKISNLLMNQFNTESITSLKINMNNFLFSFKKTDDNNDLLEYVTGFVSIVMQLIKHLSIDELEEIRSEINNTFVAIWEIVGTYNLYESLVKFYDKQVLKKYYDIRIHNLKLVAEEYLLALKDNIPVKKEKASSLNKFKGIAAKKSQ